MIKGKILIVEDNRDDEALTVRALARKNMTDIVVTRDGAEALEYLFCTGRYLGRAISDSPRLVLLDLKLPKVDGYEVLKRIRADERTRILPVVVFTSSEEESDLRKIRSSGANSYVVKPLDSGDFSNCIDLVSGYWLSLNQAAQTDRNN